MDKILLMSLGSRGDMEPFLALGAELQEAGHPIAFCMPAQFESLAHEVAPLFYPMDRAFLELVESPDVRAITGQIGSAWSRLRTMMRLLKSTKPLQQQLIRDQKAAVEAFEPDNIIFHIKCIYPVFAGINQGTKVELLSPVPCLLHPVDHEPSIGFGKPRAKWWNRFTYTLANRALINQSILSYGNGIAQDLGEHPLKKEQVKAFLLEKLPVEFAVSEALFPQPKEWPNFVRITDFRARDQRSNYQPGQELLSFLEEHPRPVFITFGSMVNAHPQQVGEAVLEVTQKLKVPVLINSSWGGIELPESLPGHAFVVRDIPYDWLLPQVRAAVHHGGSGTTHSCLQAHVPQAIIPHIGDQFLWNRAVHRAKLGPLGFPIKQFSKQKFEALLNELLRY